MVANALFAYQSGTMSEFKNYYDPIWGRRNNPDGKWDGILTTGRVAPYAILSPSNTLLGSLEWSGMYHQRLPFSLTLGDGRA